VTSTNGRSGVAKRRQLSAAQIVQRRTASLTHGLYARTEDGRRLRDHRVRYRVAKARSRYPNLGPEDVELLKALARFQILADDAFAEIRAMQLRGEEVPRRLRIDAERVQLRALELDERLRARDTSNGHDEPAGFLSIGGES